MVAVSTYRRYFYLMPRPGNSLNYAALPPGETGTVPAALLESLERSKAQAEAGLSVPLEPALDRLRASIARMRAKRAEPE